MIVIGTAGSATATGSWICHSAGGSGTYQYIPPSESGADSGHMDHADDIIPPFPGQPGGLNWGADEQLIHMNGCLTELSIPDAPGIDDPCGVSNAAWRVPEDTATLEWTLTDDGALLVETVAPFSFPRNKTVHDFGLPEETNTEPCGPVTVPVPEALGPVDPCGEGNIAWPSSLPPSETVVWSVNESGQLVATVKESGAEFAGGGTVVKFDLPEETNTEACEEPVECPNGDLNGDAPGCGPDIPSKPNGSTTVTSESQVVCSTEEVLTTTTTTVVDHIWTGTEWKRVVDTDKETKTLPASAVQLNSADCPPPTQPQAEVDETVDASLDCAVGEVTVVTTITTTPYVWDASTREYVAGTPEVTKSESTREATEAECPVVSPGESDEGDEVDEEPVTQPDKGEVEGVDADRPKPRPQPVVAGQPEALPTAVDAGLAPVVATSTSSPLGQGLLAGGLVMLLLAGALQTGRRERGTHEI